MLTLSQILGFLLTSLLLTATPGPDNLMVLSMGMSRGQRKGMAFGLGCAAGCLSHTVLAVFGVSALIAASPLAFSALKVAGGAYLLYLGFQAWRHAGRATGPVQADASESLQQLFLKGLVANVINPKVVLFFLSFLPQFVEPAQGQVAWQLGWLGVLFALQAAALFTLLALFSGVIGAWLQRRRQVAQWMDRLAALVFVGLGLRMISAK